MRAFRRIRQHLQRVTRRLKTAEAERLLSDDVMGDLICRYRDTGELPQNELQRAHILFVEAALKAMDATCQSADDPQSHNKFIAAQTALIEAARAYNVQLQAHGLPLVEEYLPRQWFNAYDVPDLGVNLGEGE